MQPIDNSLFAALTPERWRSTGYRVKFIFTLGVGSVVMWLASRIEPAYGLSRVFLALAAVVSALLVAIAILARPVNRHLPRDKLGQFRTGARDQARP